MLTGMRVVTADQPHQFLRVHVVAVAIANVLLRHRGVGAAIGDHICLLRRFRGHRAQF
ncbi:MAG TPA: hypothetical protein VF957_21970 [Bradyrhizobium sp.]